MNITFKQTIIKGILKRRFAEESIKTDVGDYVKIGNIEGKVESRIIDYESNYITIWLYPKDAIYVN